VEDARGFQAKSPGRGQEVAVPSRDIMTDSALFASCDETLSPVKMSTQAKWLKNGQES
jgi:hypothetical protein